MKRSKSRVRLFLISVFGIVAALLCAVALVACNNGFDPKTDIPGINDNAVFKIEKTHLSFALDMQFTEDETNEIIEGCGCTLVDGETGHEETVTKEMLNSGLVKHTGFELDSVGKNKYITITHKDAVNYIFYDVFEYSVTLYKDEGKQNVWKSEHASARLTDDLGLAVWVDASAYNYSTDAAARKEDEYGAERFNGWVDGEGNLVTGRKQLEVSLSGGVTLELYARYLSDEEFSELALSYDDLGRRVFSGYYGSDTEVTVPEGVTYINLAGIFSSSPEVTSVGFMTMNVPSTAQLDVPFTGFVNTTGLAEINVDAGNERYSSYQGALYSKDYKTLHFLPASYEGNEFHPNLEIMGTFACAFWKCIVFTVPDGVTKLEDYCFYRSELLRVEGYQNVEQGTGVFLGTNIPEMNISDGVATYIQLGNLNGEETYALSRITDMTITSYTVKKGTVSIFDNAFRNCTALVSVDLGDKLEKIGNFAFSGCTSLQSVALPEAATIRFGESVFYQCSSLTSFDLSRLAAVDFVSADGVEENTLPDAFFDECSSLQSVKLPATLRKIGASAFHGCSKLTSLNFEDSALKEIAPAAFYGAGLDAAGELKATLPATLSSLGRQAFSHSGITEINLEECTGLTRLEERTFEYCRRLKSVAIPAGIAEIPAYCFYYTPALKSVAFNDVTTIKGRAFGYSGFETLHDFGKVKILEARAFTSCTALESVILGDSVTTVSEYAFQSCTGLTSFTLGKNVSAFGAYTFMGTGNAFDTAIPALYSCGGLMEINVPEENEYFSSHDGVLYGKSVGGRDFGEGGVLYALPASNAMTEYALINSAKVTLPYSVQAHKTLADITLNDGLQHIGKATFYNSDKLERVNIPASVQSIGANVFLGCTGIQTVDFDEGNTAYELVGGNLVYEKGTNNLILFTGATNEVAIREGTTLIDRAMFMYKDITSILIPDSVTTIGQQAFVGCSLLETLTIGAGVETIADDAFAFLKSLKTIIVAEGNEHFKTSADNTVLYSKDGKKLWLCAVASSTITDAGAVLEGVEEIGAYAFADHRTLTSVKLPQSVKMIGEYAFYNCRSLEVFYGSAALTSIGDSAFAAANETNNAVGDTRYSDTLRTVLLYGNLTEFGNNTFYGQYGIESAYFVMSREAQLALVSGKTNSVYLTFGCPNPDGEGYVNNGGKGVSLYINSETQPVEHPSDYGYFHMVGGEPVIWNID